MPEMNGLEFVKQPPRGCTIFYGSVDDGDHRNGNRANGHVALEAGANEYVMKPFTKEIIADKLRLMGVIQ